MKKWFVGAVVVLAVMMPVARAQEVLPASEGAALQRMRAQMEAERRKEEELQLLRLEVDRLELEVEKKKAVVELGRLAGGGREVASGSVPDPGPVMALRSVVVTDARREAVLDIDGVERRVKEGGQVNGQKVRSITSGGIVLQSTDGREISVPLGR